MDVDEGDVSAPVAAPLRVVDLGTKIGGAIIKFVKRGRWEDFAEDREPIRPAQCLGVDSDPAGRKAVTDRGYQFRVLDLEDPSADLPPADYYIMWHSLEHLSSRDASKAVLARALGLARRGVTVLTPSFEYDAQLARAGLRFMWTRWVNHPSHLTVADVLEVAAAHPAWTMQMPTYPRHQVYTSAHSSLVPESSPTDEKYTPALGPKVDVTFSPPVAGSWHMVFKRKPAV